MTAAPPFWLETQAHLLARLDASPEGLSQAEASRRRVASPRVSRTSWLRLLAGTFANPLVWILLAASVASASLGESTNATLIVLIVAASALLDFSQAYRSTRAAEQLRAQVETRATVLRDGAEREVPLADIVPGDVVLLNAGALVPGDGRLLSCTELFAQEAALTGEPLPAEKNAADLGPECKALGQAQNAVFLGTSITSGLGKALMLQVGRDTQFGKIAAHLADAKPPTEFERGVQAFGALILRTVLALVTFVCVTSVWFHRPALESLLFAIALAVGLTPEFLPMIVSVSLAAGASRLAKSQVIVKRLPSIENLGSMDILCSDKTGTLTLGQIKLDRYVDVHGDEFPRVLLLAALNSSAQGGIRSPLDDAVLAHEHPELAAYRKVDEHPFDFGRRRLSVTLDGPEGRLLICKGAPESVISVCSHYTRADSKGAELPFDDEARQRMQQLFDDLGRQGYRVLAVASRNAEPYGERELCLVGLAAFLDPPRADAAATLLSLKKAGVALKILTGDNELVTRTVCENVGLSVSSILLGSDLDGLSQAALGARAETTVVFARLSPDQKHRIVRALQDRGHVVGYLGDGINDAPSLRGADVGISVHNAVDVARESADIILLQPGLGPIYAGVMEGRRSFGNIWKYLLMGTSSNFGNMFTMAAASVFLPFLPLLPAQLLLNNLLYDLSQIAIPLDHVDAALLSKPRRWDSHLIRKFMLQMGPISSLFDLLTFWVLLSWFHATPALFRSGWFVESLATQILVIFVIRSSGLPWRSRPHPALLAGAFTMLLVGGWLPYSPFASTLGFVPPPFSFLAFVAVATLVYLGLVQWIKSRLSRS